MEIALDLEHRSPIHADLVDLAEWVLDKFDRETSVLSRDLCAAALELLETVTLALKGRRQEENLELADELLIRVRVRLRMARQLGYLDDDQLMHNLEFTDGIGRQLGGWLRSLGPV